MKKQQKQTKTSDKICFFAISSTRVFWLNILSLGFYQLYWFYKNWQILRSSGIKANPTIRAWIFPFFFVFPLFMNIKNTISPDRLTHIFLWFAPCLFIIDSLLSIFMPDEILIWLLIEITVIILTSFIMRRIQNAINKHNSDNNPQITLRKKPTVGEIVTVILLPALILISCSYSYIKAYNLYKNIIAIDEPQNFMTAVTFKHLSVYPFVCEQQGYIMKNYQQEFLRAYADEIEIYEQDLRKQKTNMTEAWQKQPQNVITFIINLTFQELEEAGTTMTEIAQALEKKTISPKEACAILDRTAAIFFEKNITLKNNIQNKIKSL
uniref:DUF4234 domain-containing protein n=1 Tax=uncultured Alphaproteobacteria bacterium TaxID=91750 RepID=A0A6M4NQZ1_9PROT|nr:hypothetical protein PlAlph_2300 [uncultured Alphaproteobacteria bacterium]